MWRVESCLDNRQIAPFCRVLGGGELLAHVPGFTDPLCGQKEGAPAFSVIDLVHDFHHSVSWFRLARMQQVKLIMLAVRDLDQADPRF